MKKWILIILTFLIGASLIFHMIIPGIAFKMIEEYEPYTFEKVLSSPKMCKDYGINDCKSPSDYGFNYKEIDYFSLDSTALNGWYVPAKKPTTKCIALIHGRTSNRLKTMKYLSLVDSFDLDTEYNVFIPDLRNSGKSAPASTAMGYKFGEDVTVTLRMLQRQFNQDTVFLYGFSMGAMAISNAIGRKELKNMLDEDNIFVERIILDSPLANVKETIRDQASHIPLGDMYFGKIFSLYSKNINEFGDQMRISKLLPKDIPILILQSKDDETTLNSNLSIELNEMSDFDKLSVHYFDGPGHVRSFQDERTKSDYIESVRQFLSSNESGP